MIVLLVILIHVRFKLMNPFSYAVDVHLKFVYPALSGDKACSLAYRACADFEPVLEDFGIGSYKPVF